MAVNDYQEVICATADRYGIPRDLLAAQVAVESGGDVGAIGDAGHSRGLLQIDDVYHDYDHARMLTDAAYALDFGAGLLVGYYRAHGNDWDTALVAYNGDWRNTTHYLARVTAARAAYVGWLGDGAADGPPATAARLVNLALHHLGDTTLRDDRNGTVPTAGMCQAWVQDLYAEAGISIPTYPSAKAAGDAVPLGKGLPPLAAQVFMAGPGWSVFDHTGVHVGGGRVVSALAAITLSDGWLDLETYRGWWLPDGLTSSPVATADTRAPQTAAGNPYGPVPMLHPFWSRWAALARQGLALPMMGYPVAAETTTASGRRIQQYERGWYGTQDAPGPWDCVQLLPREAPGP